MGGDHGVKKEEEFTGTSIKNTWTKPKGDRMESGGVGMAGVGGAVGGKWRNGDTVQMFKTTVLEQQ